MEKYIQNIEENGFKAIIVVEDKWLDSIYGDVDHFDISTIEREVKEDYILRHSSVMYGHIDHLTGDWYVASGYIYLRKENGVLQRSSRYQYEKEMLA